MLNYLARYVFRVAISNSRLERIENGAGHLSLSRQSQPATAPRTRSPAWSSFAASCCTRCRAVVPRYATTASGVLLVEQQLAASPHAAWRNATATAAVDPAPDSLLPEPAAAVPAPARCPHCQLGQLLQVRSVAAATQGASMIMNLPRAPALSVVVQRLRLPYS